jgi:adenylate cyclase
MSGNISKKVSQFLGRHAKRLHATAHILVPSLMLLVAVLLRHANFNVVKDFQFKVFDSYQRQAPRVYDPAVPVRVIDLDDESLSKLGQWPWPRNKVAELVLRLSQGAAVIAFDVVFAEPDGKSPATLAGDLPKDGRLGAARSILETLPSYDSVFADTIRAVQCVKADGTRRSESDCQPSFVVLGYSLSGGETKALPPVKRNFMVKGGDPRPALTNFSNAVVPIEGLSAAAGGLGGITPFADHDGVIRRVPLVYNLGGRLMPSLAVDALRLAQGRKSVLGLMGVSEKEAFGEQTGIESVRVGKINVPSDHEGALLIHFTDEAPGRMIPAWEVFERDFDPARLGGGIVFIGTSAAGLRDLRATPLDPYSPGVLLHAGVAEQILSEHYLFRPDWADGAEMVFFIVLGVILIALMRRFGALVCALIAGGAIAALFFVSWKAFGGAFGDKRMLIDPLYPSLVVVLVYFSSSLVRFLISEAEKREVRGQFSRYLSPDLVEQLAGDPSRLVLGGETRELTLMFSDIRGFTPISEQFDAQGLTQFINRFLTPMTDIVIKHRGTIDKYMGDCIMAFWNAPLGNENHARDACAAALVMRKRLLELNRVWEEEAKREGKKYLPVKTGFGLNTGECCVGNMGSDQRFDYSVLGDAVNLASRLEGQSKGYGVDIVIGKNTREQIPDFATIELDLIRVKGKTIPEHIYTLLGGPDLAATPFFVDLEEWNERMIGAYRAQDWDAAAEALVECRKLDSSLEKFYDLYETRIAEGRANPPGEDWDGVYTATTK